MTPSRGARSDVPIGSSATPRSGAMREHDAHHAAAAALTNSELQTHKQEVAAKSSPQAGNACADLMGRVAEQGDALPAATKQEMEQRFGHDFSRVRVMANDEADQLAIGLGARAFTVGENIAFARGEFAPGSQDGRRLLAHELAHVVQQREAGQAEVALQPAPKRSLAERVVDIQQMLDSASTKAARQPAVQQALGLADTLAAALAAANGPNPPTSGTTVEDARDGLIRLGRSLANNDEADAAIKVARKSKDAEVRNSILNSLRNRAGGVSGQQSTLGKVAPMAGEKVGPATQGEKSTKWLEKSTSAIGRTFGKLEQEGMQGFEGVSKGRYEAPEGREHAAGLEMSQELLEQYFEHVPRDVKPDPLGKVSHLEIDPNTNKIEADCDVYATYGARLLRAQGWETAGYLAIVPEEKKAGKPDEDRDAHAVAMAKKANPAGGWTYVGISNEVIRDLSIWSSDENARVMLLRLALEIYAPPLKKFKAYYLPAGKDGALDMKLLDPKANGLTPIAQGSI